MNDYILTPAEVTLRLLVAAGLGSIVGWERERKDGAAGLRTHMLVCVGSSLIMIVSAFGFGDVLGKSNITLDPSRIAAQVISGIGFLGAGTILFLRPQVIKGLTTAAGLWVVAAVGLAVGGGLYWAAVITTVIIFLILAVVKPLEQSIFKNQRIYTFTVTIDPVKVDFAHIEQIMKKNDLKLSEVFLHSTSDRAHDQIRVILNPRSDKDKIMIALKELKAIEGIHEIYSSLNLKEKKKFSDS